MAHAEDITRWVDLAKYDLQTAEAMLASGRHLYVLFTCQQATEKTLKGIIVHRTDTFPPRVHDLLRLAEVAGIDLPEDQRGFLVRLSAYYIETRYPEEVQRLMSEVDREMAEETLAQTKEMMEWLDQLLK